MSYTKIQRSALLSFLHQNHSPLIRKFKYKKINLPRYNYKYSLYNTEWVPFQTHKKLVKVPSQKIYIQFISGILWTQSYQQYIKFANTILCTTIYQRKTFKSTTNLNKKKSWKTITCWICVQVFSNESISYM